MAIRSHLNILAKNEGLPCSVGDTPCFFVWWQQPDSTRTASHTAAAAAPSAAAAALRVPVTAHRVQLLRPRATNVNRISALFGY
jgi:hypothetical protein